MGLHFGDLHGEVLVPLVAPVEVAARISQPDSAAVPAGRPVCPQPSQRNWFEAPKPPAVLVETGARNSHPGLNPEARPAPRSCPRLEAKRTTVGEAKELPSNFLVDS